MSKAYGYSLSDNELSNCSDDEYIYYDEDDIYSDLMDYSLATRTKQDLTKTYNSLKNISINSKSNSNSNHSHQVYKYTQPWNKIFSGMTKRCNLAYSPFPTAHINKSAISQLTNKANR